MGGGRTLSEESVIAQSTVLWQRIDLPGHEICQLVTSAEGWRLSGVALVAHDGRPCRLDYEILCDASWETRSAHIWGHIGGAPADLVVVCAPNRTWSVNGSVVPLLDGCIDIDLGFSPSTNLLPVRRLTLSVGERAAVRAAWVRFPNLGLEVLEQSYTRIGPLAYRYESANGAFTRDLSVDANGFVLEYPGLWRAETQAVGV